MKDPRFISRHGLGVNVPIKQHTTIQSGGNADFFVEISDQKKFVKALDEARANNVSVTILGQGSRSVVSDYGVRGLVIRNQMSQVNLTGRTVEVQSGVSLNNLIQYLASQQLGGFEQLVGHAGSLGGCLREPSALLEPLRQAVTLVSVWRDGKAYELPLERLQEIDNPAIISVQLVGEPRAHEDLQRTMLQATQQRLKRYPAGVAHVRVFSTADASDLLRELNMSSERVGGAVISGKDPNYIINDKNATSREVYELAQRMKHRVAVKLQHRLAEAVTWVGEW